MSIYLILNGTSQIWISDNRSQYTEMHHWRKQRYSWVGLDLLSHRKGRLVLPWAAAFLSLGEQAGGS